MLAESMIDVNTIDSIEELEILCNNEDFHEDISEATESLLDFLGEDALQDVKRLVKKYRGVYPGYVLNSTIEEYCEKHNLCADCFSKIEERVTWDNEGSCYYSYREEYCPICEL